MVNVNSNEYRFDYGNEIIIRRDQTLITCIYCTQISYDVNYEYFIVKVWNSEWKEFLRLSNNKDKKWTSEEVIEIAFNLLK